MMEGLIQIYTGDGKGKTTAALGLAVRACGHGFKVYMIQFMKAGWDYGELKTAMELSNFTIRQFGRPVFVDKNNPSQIDIALANEAFDHAEEIVKSGKYDLVILDEINVALDYKLIALEKVLDLVRNKPEGVELILTGRNAPKELIEIADLTTEMRDIKHPYAKGIHGRRGVDY
ncbi:MAG: cob(I)yrinic acid a,c-diamide adenosyltransferase [Nitrososphaeria archaeon]|nr:cob(I)yrinic acid a,c-diamide adenosyltransferase [Nitrososphaeria archaeon]NIN52167.1 cob(I)yrinic acid a,c-diamide adenosyltransferase [Nitrososphaeria archaeon]NIQ32620.1 cob(I)yrinic acid a,c-diamide adenosyltransferase [Nitrososphaeria archaeon]